MRFRKRKGVADESVEVGRVGRAGADGVLDRFAAPRPRARARAASSRSGIDRSTRCCSARLFAFFWWQKIDDNPIKSVADALWETFQKQAWVLVLLALEWVRQIHFFLAERWGGYYRFWKSTVFGRFDGRSQRLDPWTRSRLARVLRWLFALVIISVIVGQIADQSPVERNGQPARPHERRIADGGPPDRLPAADDQPVRPAVLVPRSRAASRPTSPTTSRPASTTCGARTRSARRSART